MHSKVLWALASAACAVASVLAKAAGNDRRPGIVSLEEMKAWVDSQDPADITIIGDPFGLLAPRNALLVTVTYCSTVTSNGVCTGPCTVSTGTGICLDAPFTNCLSATSDVSFCGGPACQGECHTLNTCGGRLQNNFCFTPGTKSIAIPAGS